MGKPTSFGRSISLRIIIIALLVLVLLIPISMVTGLIHERQQRSREVTAEVTAKWADTQQIGGIVLTLPYQKHWKDSDGKEQTSVSYVQLLPESLNIKGSLNPFERQRGIYKVILYVAEISYSGAFNLENLSKCGVPLGDMIWSDAFVSIGITDMRGINEAMLLNWNGNSYQLEPGVRQGCDLFDTGVSVPVAIEPAAAEQSVTPINFSFALDLNGSEAISFLPLGQITTAEMSSEWASPSFEGAFLPQTRSIDSNGFIASWKVLDFNRNYPQQWVGNIGGAKLDEVREYDFGVMLFSPIDQYSQSLRALKYAILFVGLTFLIFFTVEVFNRRRIHPVQYLLVGLALCLFYVLLLSLSEHIAFAAAYVIAALACLVLITVYVGSALQSKVAALATAATLAGLYAFMYVLLSNEDYALLIGSVGLFVIMVAVMLLTRKVDWYRIELRQESAADAEPSEPWDEPRDQLQE